MRNALRVVILFITVMIFVRPVLADQPINSDTGSQECFEYVKVPNVTQFTGGEITRRICGLSSEKAEARILSDDCQYIGNKPSNYKRIYRKGDGKVICQTS